MQGQQRTLSFAGALDSTPLRSFLCGLAYGAAKLDSTSVGGSVEQFAERSPQFLKDVTAWVDQARAPGASLHAQQMVLAAYPAEAVRNLPIGRWKEICETLRRRLETNLDMPRLIGEWRQAVVDTPFGRVDSELRRRVGGADLTEAAQRYLTAFSLSEQERFELIANACMSLRRAIETPDSDPVVLLIAPALLQLAFYHSGRGAAAADVSPPDFPTVLQPLGASMRALAARCRRESVEVAWLAGLGFAEISPRHEDVDLEVSLGRTQNTQVG